MAVGLHTLSGGRLRDGFGILTYHRVVDRSRGVESPTINVTPRRLRQQLEGLLLRGFQAWPLRAILEACRESRPIPPNVFAVTFDDGFENNLHCALPILEELRIPATIFLATAFLDSERPFPFDNWSGTGSTRVAAASWRPLSTAQCRELLTHDLIDLGVHTHTHGVFTERVEEFRWDLSVSIDILKDCFGISHPTFSFPYGITTPELIAAARQAGVSCALSTRPERIHRSLDPFHWGRFTASDLDTAATLAAKLSGWYTPVAHVLREIKRPIAALAPGATGELITIPEPCFAVKGEKTEDQIVVDSQTNHPPLRWQAPWVVACRAIGIMATLASNILTARLLGPVEFGLYLVLSSVAAFGSLIGSAGLSSAALRFCAESLAIGRRELALAYLRRTRQLCVVSTVLAAGLTIGGLFAIQFATGRRTDSGALVALTVITMAALAWQQLAGETLRGWNNLKLASLFSGGISGGPISNLLFFIGITALLLARVPMTAIGVIGLLAGSVCLTVPFALWCCWRVIHDDPAHPAKPAVKLTALEDRQLLAMARTLLAVLLLAFVSQQLDIWIGEAFLPPDELGVYGVAKRIMLVVAMPVQMAMLTIVATIPRLHVQGRRGELQNLMRGSSGLAAVPSLAALGLLVLIPGPILHLLFGVSYLEAAPLIRILSVGQLALILAGNSITVLSMTGRQQSALKVNLIVTAIMGIGGSLTALRWGASGLAWTSAAALVFQSVSLWWLARLHLGIWTHASLPKWQFVKELSIDPRSATQSQEITRRPTRANSSLPLPISTEVVTVFSSESNNL
jgi:O-antigen/teichoic acid export membrane protein/peptidoglycan/xylan/chitin deacetylase (PgdA/CDA1 family)